MKQKIENLNIARRLATISAVLVCANMIVNQDMNIVVPMLIGLMGVWEIVFQMEKEID